ncbi:MAG: 23S rRNA (guanosine(2251)-2'-O)-methyltransferase RlmB [Anaerovorax sp.]
METIIIGRNPVLEALKNDREIEKILVTKDGAGSVKKIVAMAKEKKLTVMQVDKPVLDRLADGGSHQGVVAYVSAHAYIALDELIEKALEAKEEAFLIILDGVEDPHNFGAIIRTADGAGAQGIIIPKRRAVGITETVAKASAGAVEYVPVAKVSNIVQTIERLKKEGFWIGACDMDGELYHQANLTGKFALVIGGEGQGISRLVRETCDFIVSIPMSGKINSLNASNAAAILMYEVKRQRDGKR